MNRPFEHVATFVQEFAAEWNRLAAEASADTAVQRRELEVVERKLASLIDAISDGLRAPGLQQKLDELEHRKVTLQRVLERAPASAPLRLHPNLAEVYRDRVARLPDEAFNAGRDGAAVLEQARGLIDRVVVHPAREGGGPEIELIGEITSMIDLALGRHDVRDRRHGRGDRDLFDCSVKVVAGIGFEPMTFRL
jgi:site-specific DNA recombinase